MIDNEAARFGSSRFATVEEIERAGLFKKTPHSVLIGFLCGRPIYANGTSGLLLQAGARGGKMRDLLAYSLCQGIYHGPLVMLDMKGEGAYLSQIQTQKYAIRWNPTGLHKLGCDSLNPVEYIRIDCPNLVSNTKVFCQNFIPLTSAKEPYFEGRAQQFLEAIVLTLVRIDGVLTLPRLYEVITLIPGGGDAWLDFAFEMSEAGFEISKSVEEEIAAARGQDSGGFRGILGELFKAVACLSDPVLMAAVSPPFDFSIADLCRSDRTYQLYLMPPAEFVDAWAPVIKSIFVAALIYKSRQPQAPMQTWVLDECAQLGKFPAVTKLFTYGAGIGIRPLAVFQSKDQMNALGPNAETIITSSAGTQINFSVRDFASASQLSRRMGTQTLTYNDTPLQAKAKLEREQAMQSLLNGGDEIEAIQKIAHYGAMQEHRSEQQRLLRTPDEILGMPDDKAIIFADGVARPIYADRKPYFAQRFMAGRYLPNPFHPPLDRVQVKTLLGSSWRQVIREPVPAQYAHLPQYADGWWSYIEGFRP